MGESWCSVDTYRNSGVTKFGIAFLALFCSSFHPIHHAQSFLIVRIIFSGCFPSQQYFVDCLQYSVSRAGDVNGDGYRDIVIDTGAVYVVFGHATGTTADIALSSFNSVFMVLQPINTEPQSGGGIKGGKRNPART